MNLFHITIENTNSSPQIFSLLSFKLVLLLIFIQQYRYAKSRPDGRVILKELILPEFNSEDEREAELTGKAAKAAFSTIIIFSLFLTVLISLPIFDTASTFWTYIAITSIPISGLIAYYFSYRYYYLR